MITERHIETIELMMQGLLVKQIAHRMHVTERTVKEFRRQAMERMGAKTSCELVAKYIYEKHGLQVRALPDACLNIKAKAGMGNARPAV